MRDICGAKFHGDPADVWGTGACCPWVPTDAGICQAYAGIQGPTLKLTRTVGLKVTLGLWSCDHWHLFWSQSILETPKIWTKMKRRCKKRYTHNTCNWATSFTVPDVVSNRWITRTWRLVTGLHFWRWIIKEYQGQETQRWEMSYCLLVCFEMEEQQTLSR